MSFELITIKALSLIDLAVFTTSMPLAVAFYVIYRRIDRQLRNLIVANIFLCSAFYAFAVFMVDNANTPMPALVWTRIQYSLGAVIAASFFHLVIVFTGERGPVVRRFISIIYFISFGMILITYSPAFVHARTNALCTPSWLCVAPWMPEMGPLQAVFVLFWFPLCGYCIFKLYKSTSLSPSEQPGVLPHNKQLLIGFIILIITAMVSCLGAQIEILNYDLTLIGIMAVCLPAASALREQLVQRERLRGALSRYLSPDVAKDAMKSELKLGGVIREVTILFADIRGFTATAEAMTPEQVVSFLNQYFTAMAKPIFQYGGMLNKLYGDGLLAVFGAPNTLDNHALAATQAAYEMQNILKLMNRERDQGGLLPIRVGIGLHSGHVIIGNVGTSDHMDYTPIGDTVNVASRIEEYTKKTGHPILVTGATYERVKPYVLAEPAGEAPIREGERSVPVMAINGLR